MSNVYILVKGTNLKNRGTYGTRDGSTVFLENYDRDNFLLIDNKTGIIYSREYQRGNEVCSFIDTPHAKDILYTR